MNTVGKTIAGDASQTNEQLLHALREDFDLAFSREPGGGNGQAENFLVLEIAGDAYALRVTQISGLFAGRSITPLPSSLPELIGLAGFRAQVTPVYDLASLLGYAQAKAPKWIAVLSHHTPVAVAFDEFLVHLSVTPEQITGSGLRPSQERTAGSHLHDAIQENGRIFPIIDLQTVLQEIQQRVDATRSIKER